MDNRTEDEIDLLDLLLYLKKKLWIIILSFLVCAAAGFAFTYFFIDTEYTATTRMYVLNRSSESNVAYSDFQVSNQLMEDYKVLITGENVTKEVIRQLGLDMSASQLSKKISVTAKDNTRVLQINVTDTDPQRAAEIANCVREISGEQIQQIMDVDAVNLVYAADVPQSPSGPNVMKNTILAALVGLVAAVGIFVVIYLIDDTIRTEEDVERYLGLSTLGVIPMSPEFEKMTRSTTRQPGAGKNARQQPAAAKK